MASSKRPKRRRGGPRVRRRTVRVVDGQVTDAGNVKNLPFMGEEMTCIICGKKERSDPQIESGWRALQIDGVNYYACPAEFPPDGAGVAAFKAAYTDVIFAVMEARKSMGGGRGVATFFDGENEGENKSNA